MEKTLILYSNNTAYFFPWVDNPSICIRSVYRSNKWMKNRILSVLRKMGCKYTRLFYGSWYKELQDYSKIIVFDTPVVYDRMLLRNISIKANGARKYCFLWNIVKDIKFINNLKNEAILTEFGLYSYNKLDCDKFELIYNPGIYVKKKYFESSILEYDSFFLGFLKDKKEKLCYISEIFKLAGMHLRCVIINPPKDSTSLLDCEFRYREIPYNEYLTMLSKSRSVLDITQKGQDGLSLRVMEAIFFDRKLITTNASIKDFGFYNPSNILIFEVGKTTARDIIDFFKKDFIPYSSNIKDFYSLDKWIARFQ